MTMILRLLFSWDPSSDKRWYFRVWHQNQKSLNLILDWEGKPDINSGLKISQSIKEDSEENLKLEHSAEYEPLRWTIEKIFQYEKKRI